MSRKFSLHRASTVYTHSTRGIRAHFGLTQAELASYLRVSRAAVAMHETQGTALDLQLDCLLKEIQLTYYSLSPEDADYARAHGADIRLPEPLPPPSPDEAAAVRKALERRLRTAEYEALRLRQAQTRDDLHRAQLQRRRQALPALAALLPAPPDDARDRSWLDWFGRGGYLRFDTPAERAARELRLAVLDFEIAEATRRLAETGRAG